MSRYVVAVCLATAAAATTTSDAAPVVGGSATYDYFNAFFVRFPPTSPFYPGDPNAPGATDIDVLIEYTGVLTEVWQDQVGDQIDFEITNIFGTGDLGGTPFEIRGGASAPELDPFIGTFTSIVQDPDDPGFATGDPSSLTSAFRSAAGPFAQVLNPGTPEELFLYSASPYGFENTITSLPYELGQELLGTDDSLVDVRLMVGDSPDPINDPVIGQALPNGFVEIIPEPAAALLLATGVASFAIRRR